MKTGSPENLDNGPVRPLKARHLENCLQEYMGLCNANDIIMLVSIYCIFFSVFINITRLHIL
jgi:hypothetical protein